MLHHEDWFDERIAEDNRSLKKSSAFTAYDLMMRGFKRDPSRALWLFDEENHHRELELFIELGYDYGWCNIVDVLDYCLAQEEPRLKVRLKDHLCGRINSGFSEYLWPIESEPEEVRILHCAVYAGFLKHVFDKDVEVFDRMLATIEWEGCFSGASSEFYVSEAMRVSEQFELIAPTKWKTGLQEKVDLLFCMIFGGMALRELPDGTINFAVTEFLQDWIGME